MRWIIALFTWLLIGTNIPAQEVAATQRAIVETDRAWKILWRTMIEKPTPKFTIISKDDLRGLFGIWQGTSKDHSEKADYDLRINADGTWTSKYRPDVKSPHWYFFNGKIQLWEGAPSPDGTFVTFAFLQRQTFTLGKCR